MKSVNRQNLETLARHNGIDPKGLSEAELIELLEKIEWNRHRQVSRVVRDPRLGKIWTK